MLKGDFLAEAIYKTLPESLSLTLVIIQVGDNKASNLYISIKKARLKSLGWHCIHVRLDSGVTKSDFEHEIRKYSNDESVHGIIVQMPLPSHLMSSIDKIPHYKDVDGITIQNQGMLFKGYPEDDYIAPCTALACMHFIKSYEVNLIGKHVAVIGKSFLVGKPISILLQAQGASVVNINKHDTKQQELTSKCSVVISAVGSPHFVTKDYVKENAFVVDIGVSKVGEKVFGDIDPSVYEKTPHISSVKGGIGPLTVAFLVKNLLKCYTIRARNII
jgi:5,10-methylene-tetrahydrofolate dehydrogenase/methenyl tetrahydrofolate cyclohydrolase